VDRRELFLQPTDRTKQIVELGAGYDPIAPKAAGWRTHIVDHASREVLQAKYAGVLDTSAIEEVDTVWEGGPLDEAVPAALRGNVDILIASNVLEHIPDPIGFYQSASRLVRSGGRMIVALPDRRYCFDCFKPWSTTGEMVEVHAAGIQRHTLKTAYNHVAYFALNDGQFAWPPGPAAPALNTPFELAAQAVRNYQNNPGSEYLDFHTWQFTESSYRLILLELAAIGLIDWHIEDTGYSKPYEFYAILRRSHDASLPAGDHLKAQRQELLLRQLAEVREQADFFLGPSVPATPSATAELETEFQRLRDKLQAQDGRLNDIGERMQRQEVALQDIRDCLARQDLQLERMLRHDGALQHIHDTLAHQNLQLRRITETLGWLRALLSPIRTIWRARRGR
jgi:SAM-dependent methyltransferase